MKVAWMTLPLGIFVTIVACLFVFWWQQISYFSPYGQAVLINGNPMKPFVICIPFLLLWVINGIFHNIVSPENKWDHTSWNNTCLVSFLISWTQFTCYARLCMHFGAFGWAFVYSFTEPGLAWITVDGWDSSYLLTVLDNVLFNCQANWNGKILFILRIRPVFTYPIIKQTVWCFFYYSCDILILLTGWLLHYFLVCQLLFSNYHSFSFCLWTFVEIY